MQKLGALIKNKSDYIEALFYIQDKQQRLALLKLNGMQRHLQENRSHRVLGLKARQMGFTTGILADYFHDTITIPNTVMVVMSHEEVATQRILAKVHCFYDHMPREFRPKIHHDSAYQMSFPGLGSWIYIGTAGARAFGRGDTIHRFLGTEVAHWPEDKAEKILIGVEEAVPDTGYITLETTANGEGGCFYERYVVAMQGEGSYRRFFFPWWWDEEYAYEEGDERALAKDRGPITLTPEEELLMLKHNLTIPQIRWRRRKMADLKDLFFQEYPEDEQTCFLSGSRAVWPTEILKEMLSVCRPPLKTEDKLVQIWQSPRPGESYVVGVDPAEGAPPEEEGRVAPEGLLVSKCAIEVVNARTLENVAAWEGYLEPNELAMLAADVAREYNTALISVERNNHGHAVLNTLRNWIKYPRLYRYRDPVDRKGSPKYGWLTDAKTRPQLIANFGDLIKSRSLMGVVWDEGAIFQMRNFRHLRGGRLGMPPKIFSDKLFALMIAYETRGEALMGYAEQHKVQHYGRRT